MRDDVADRLYADAVAAIFGAQHFVETRDNVTLDDVAAHARLRGKTYVDDLNASAALVERGWGKAEKRWMKDARASAEKPTTVGRTSRWRDLALLTAAAETLLVQSGRETLLKVDASRPGREILQWRYLSLAMPSSVLLAAATARSDRRPGKLRLLHASMAPDHPVAHQHLHHAAMPSFEELWASVRLRSVLDPSDLHRSLRDSKAWCPGLHAGSCYRSRDHAKHQIQRNFIHSARHMENWGGLLSQAFSALDLLSRHAGHAQALSQCQDPKCTKGLAALCGLLRTRSRPQQVRFTTSDREGRTQLARRYRAANAEGAFRRSQTLRRTFIRDEARSETHDLSRAFTHARSWEAEPHDPTYDLVLLQYLRVKSALFRVIVHGPGEHGLKKFLEHFSQIKVYEPRSDQLRPTSPDEPGLVVCSTEYRVAPDAWLREVAIAERDHRGLERRIEELEPGKEAGEAAWLIHFKRFGHNKKLLPLFGRQVREMDAEARHVGNALEQNPRRLRKLRGIDICGVEEQQPLWVSAETLRGLRARSSAIAARRPALDLQPLRLTLHAGEDFLWLTSGTRAVAEPFHWNLVQRGDRIGHGIGLTLKAGPWWRRHHGTTIPSTPIDRLHDLAFLATYTEPLDEPGLRRAMTAQRTVDEDQWLSDAIKSTVELLGLPTDGQKDSGADFVSTARSFWKIIGGRTTRRLLDQPETPGKEAPLHERWLHAYLWKRSVQKQAASTLLLPVDETTWPERDLLRRARLRLVREVARWQVPIESNPSSNLVVASLDAMASQDFLAQTIHETRGPGRETVPWTISTDDPITFATTLSDEYAYAWAGMVMRKKNPYDPAHARSLLDQAAATSVRTKFSLPEKRRDPA